MKAYLNNHHQTPRKTSLVADAVRGKTVEYALAHLTFMHRKSASVIKKLLESAVANARQQGADTKDLVVKTIMVDKGQHLRRSMPRSKGRATPFRRQMSHITIELGPKAPAKKKVAKKIKDTVPAVTEVTA
jgi:large subunit ribosomal protein L22